LRGRRAPESAEFCASAASLPGLVPDAGRHGAEVTGPDLAVADHDGRGQPGEVGYADLGERARRVDPQDIGTAVFGPPREPPEDRDSRWRLRSAGASP
jgi:hypothetical protein